MFFRCSMSTFQRCAGLNNFSTSRSVLAALDSSVISRLRQTWAVSTIFFDVCFVLCRVGITSKKQGSTGKSAEAS